MKMKKECELCNSPARLYCESDGASLCSDCDLKIHSANFLVAKHTRTLLCQACQAPTPWKASGANLGSTLLSVCQKCVVSGEDEDGYQETEQSGSSDECGESSDTDNQVVPLTRLDPGSSSSSSEESSNRFVSLLKRFREDAPLQDEDDDLYGTSSSSEGQRSKARKIEELILSDDSEKESDVLVSSLRKFHQEINTCSAILDNQEHTD